MVNDHFVRRQTVYFPSGSDVLFGWLHTPSDAQAVGGVAIICGPLGHEYMSSHRSIRALANSLASKGIAALRFDYRNVGDSSGENAAVGQLDGFIEDIAAAISLCKNSFDDVPVTLVGIGLGGTFATLTCEKVDVDSLVVWGACVDGRRFIRSQRALSRVLTQVDDGDEGVIDAAGIVLPVSAAREFEQVDLRKKIDISVSSMLILGREDAPEDAALFESLREQSVAVEYKSVPGYMDMITIPTDTKVPLVAIDVITQWVAERGSHIKLPLDGSSGQWLLSHVGIEKVRISRRSNAGESVSVKEYPVHFGRAVKLFGVITESLKESGKYFPERAVVFLNCGSEHHVGPHRIYTHLARAFAAQGFTCLRLDIEGIGDSLVQGGNKDNFPYSPVAMRDINEALSFLKEEKGCVQFLMMGICAGAYHSFRSAVAIHDFNIVGAVLINPLVFQWEYDVPEGESRNTYGEVSYYKRAFFQPTKWLKLFSGGVDIKNIFVMTFKILSTFVAGYCNRVAGLIFGRELSKLSADIRLCFASGRRIWTIFAEGDPGHSLIMTEAPGAVAKGVKKGLFSIDIIQHADHGFSKGSMRKDLMARLCLRIESFFEIKNKV